MHENGFTRLKMGAAKNVFPDRKNISGNVAASRVVRTFRDRQHLLDRRHTKFGRPAADEQCTDRVAYLISGDSWTPSRDSATHLQAGYI